MRLALALGVLLLAGCAAPEPPSRTGGLTLEMQVEGEDNLLVLYRVEADGTLVFAGGADVRRERVTWTGTMSDREIETLRSLLREHHWLDGGPAAGETPSEHVTRIRVRWPGGKLRETVRGRSADVSPVEAHLAGIASRRLDPYLESLPKAETRPDEP